jgi:hypothetical protein
MQKVKRIGAKEFPQKRLVDLLEFWTGRNRKTITSIISRGGRNIADPLQFIAVFYKLYKK